MKLLKRSIYCNNLRRNRLKIIFVVEKKCLCRAGEETPHNDLIQWVGSLRNHMTQQITMYIALLIPTYLLYKLRRCV